MGSNLYNAMRAYVAGGVISCIAYGLYIFLIDEEQMNSLPVQEKAAAAATEEEAA